MTFNSGYKGTATIGGNEVPLINWSVSPTADMVKFMNSKSGGYVLREATFKDCTVSFEIDYDFDANPFAAPTNITVGVELTNVRLYLNGTSGSYWNFPKLKVIGTPQQLQVTGKITTKVNCAINGTFAYPV